MKCFIQSRCVIYVSIIAKSLYQVMGIGNSILWGLYIVYHLLCPFLIITYPAIMYSRQRFKKSIVLNCAKENTIVSDGVYGIDGDKFFVSLSSILSG